MKNEIRQEIKSRRKNQLQINDHVVIKNLVDEKMSTKELIVNRGLNRRFVENKVKNDRTLKNQAYQL
jgi:hypothetical protein